MFGSVACNEQGTGSDIDLLVRFKSDASLLDEAGLEIALRDLLQCPIDVIGDDVIREEFRDRILKEAVML